MSTSPWISMPSTSDLLGAIRAGSRLFSMDIHAMLAELRGEHARIEEAILTLERLAAGQGKRRGRPPAWMAKHTGKRRGRPPGSKHKAKDATA